MKALEPIYKSAEELGITERERSELIEAVPYFLGLAQEEFRMCDWSYCACGHIARRNGRDPDDAYNHFSPALKDLYCMDGNVWSKFRQERSMWYVRPTDMARAIVAFLSGGIFA